jgi:hypothetical protein
MIPVVIPGLAAVSLAGATLSSAHDATDAPQREPRTIPPGQPDPAVESVSATGLTEAESEQVGIGALVPGEGRTPGLSSNKLRKWLRPKFIRVVQT